MATFELYGRSTIGLCLTETSDEMVSSGTLSPELAIQVLVQFDKSMTEAVENQVKSKVTIKGHLHTYRFCDNVWTFILLNAVFKNEECQETVGLVKIVACDSKLLTQRDVIIHVMLCRTYLFVVDMATRHGELHELLGVKTWEVVGGDSKEAPTNTVENVETKKWKIMNAKAEFALKKYISHLLFKYIMACKSAYPVELISDVRIRRPITDCFKMEYITDGFKMENSLVSKVEELKMTTKGIPKMKIDGLRNENDGEFTTNEFSIGQENGIRKELAFAYTTEEIL
ncbi:hypothetical protein HHK36_019582 [Tetracentron sinense]|uniref:Transcription initiation factor IIA subunit 2 n=1 Tax=Tetracentron sinense TaxID=13715 RepID=A0A834Z2G0_TETSI|nr:hypothetical protein HHK36_019582 [Tetracentron sinense]